MPKPKLTKNRFLSLKNNLSVIEWQLLELIQQKQPVSRMLLVKSSGLSRTTVHNNLERLIRRKIITRSKQEKTVSPQGRPEIFYSILEEQPPPDDFLLLLFQGNKKH